jgi:putative peptide zinc metalloprotease protein
VASRPDVPVLVPGTRFSRQQDGGKVRFVVRVGLTGRYLRIGEAEQAILALMDGARTVEQVRTGYIAARKENLDAATLATFLDAMRRQGVVEPTAEAKNLLLVEKARQRRQEVHFAGSVGSLLFLRRKLFDPDRILDAMRPWTNFLFTRTFVVVAFALFVAASVVLASRWQEASAALQAILKFEPPPGSTYLYVWCTALVLVFTHEFGHGVACKHHGGEVHEMGILLMFFQPCFYCNVNDAWTFESRAARVWVTAAGGFIEAVIGSACVLIWNFTEPGTGIHAVTQVVFTISLTGTLLFNLNPLIKLDGYYILADLLAIENLRERSMAQVGYLFRRHLLRLPAKPASAAPREARILGLYGVLSMAYMAGLILTIAGAAWGMLAGPGGMNLPGMLFLAVLLYFMVRQPAGALIASGREVWMGNAALRRPRNLGIAGGALAAAAAGSFLVPWTREASGPGHVEPVRVVEVRSPVAGTVTEVLVRPGEVVAEGATLLRIDAPLEVALARRDRVHAQVLRRAALQARASGDGGTAVVRDREADAAEGRLADAERRLAGASPSAPLAGVVLDARPGDLEGVPVLRDQPLLGIGAMDRLRFVARLGPGEASQVLPGMKGRVRLRALPGEVVEGEVVGVGRGPAPDRPHGPGEPTAREFEVVLEAPSPGPGARAGMTGEVRIAVARTTLGAAMVRSLARTVGLGGE